MSNIINIDIYFKFNQIANQYSSIVFLHCKFEIKVCQNKLQINYFTIQKNKQRKDEQLWYFDTLCIINGYCIICGWRSGETVAFTRLQNYGSLNGWIWNTTFTRRIICDIHSFNNRIGRASYEHAKLLEVPAHQRFAFGCIREPKIHCLWIRR